MECIKKYDVCRQDCISREILAMIGAKWTSLILNTLRTGPHRYSAIHRAVPGVTQKVLTGSLRELEYSGIITRRVYPVMPPRVEYSLTSLGLDLVAVLHPLMAWAEDHADEVKQSRAVFVKDADKTIQFDS